MHRNMQYEYDQSGDFDDSVIIDPIAIKSHINPTLFHHSNIGQDINFGPYNDIKLVKYLDYVSEYPQKVVEIINIDPISLFVDIAQQGAQLLQMHSSHDVILCGVIGQRQSGKSLFLDKMFNLAGVKGNHFTLARKPGIYAYSIPFIKNGVKIFFLEMITSSAMGSNEFLLLNKIMLMLCSSLILINDLHNKQCNIKNYQKTVNFSLKNVLFKGNQLTKKSNVKILPQLIVNLIRQQSDQLMTEQFHSQFFENVKYQLLSNAMNKKYKGSERDLTQVSFMANQCINQDYIRNIGNIFRVIYLDAQQKKYNGLTFNGNIILKTLRSITNSIKHDKFIECQKMFYQITRQLYTSAFNYCVLIYQEYLEKQFQDQQPKNIDKILEIFQQGSLTVFSKFNQFNLEPSLNEEFQKKLADHIDQKQRMILEINDKKSINKTQKAFSSINFEDSTMINKNLKSIEKKCVQTAGRDQTIAKKLGQILKKIGSESNNVDYRAMKQIEKLTDEKALRKKQLQVIKKSNQGFYLQEKQKQQQMDKLNAKNKELQKKLTTTKNQLDRLKSKQLPDPKKYESQLKKITQQSAKNYKTITQLENQLKGKQYLNNIKDQKQKQIAKIVQRQKQIEQELRAIQAKQIGGGQKKESKNAMKQSNTKQNASKIKQASQIKKGSKIQKKNPSKDQASKIK